MNLREDQLRIGCFVASLQWAFFRIKKITIQLGTTFRLSKDGFIPGPKETKAVDARIEVHLQSRMERVLQLLSQLFSPLARSKSLWGFGKNSINFIEEEARRC